MACADDIDLFGGIFIMRDRHLSSFCRNGRRIGLEAKEEKTKAMTVSRIPRDVDYVVVGELVIEVVDQF